MCMHLCPRCPSLIYYSESHLLYPTGRRAWASPNTWSHLLILVILFREIWSILILCFSLEVTLIKSTIPVAKWVVYQNTLKMSRCLKSLRWLKLSTFAEISREKWKFYSENANGKGKLADTSDDLSAYINILQKIVCNLATAIKPQSPMTIW